MKEPDGSRPGHAPRLRPVLRRIMTWIGLRQRRPAAHVQDEESGRGAPSVPPSPQARHAGHETTDMSGRTMMWVLISLGASVAGAIGVIFALLTMFQGELRQDRPPLTAEQTASLPPPQPTLEAAPESDLARLRAGEYHLLHAYAWIDANHTRARIPIDRAITLVTGRKLDGAP